ncbi:hypothetical protein ACQP2P_34530 [Dactylosporangium sp. CA-139114]|uniref:hypothetical protein n=1 Tax=Dactylosporangium sp. CA-139114 TaxID=3239931 RepID=UPI003D97A154
MTARSWRKSSRSTAVPALAQAAAPAAEDPRAAPGRHRGAARDTLWGLAHRNGTTVADLPEQRER